MKLQEFDDEMREIIDELWFAFKVAFLTVVIGFPWVIGMISIADRLAR